MNASPSTAIAHDPVALPGGPSRYQCVIDLLALQGKEKVILHVPQNVYARLSKSSALDPGSKEVHIYLGKKRPKFTALAPPTTAASLAAYPASKPSPFTIVQRLQTTAEPLSQSS